MFQEMFDIIIGKFKDWKTLRSDVEPIIVCQELARNTELGLKTKEIPGTRADRRRADHPRERQGDHPGLPQRVPAPRRAARLGEVHEAQDDPLPVPSALKNECMQWFQ